MNNQFEGSAADYTVRTQPMYVMNADNEPVVSPLNALQREDNNEYVGYGVSGRYGIIQNKDVERLILEAMPGADIERRRVLNGGQVAQFLVNLGEDFVIRDRKGKDHITRYINVVNTFGNNRPVMIGISNTVFSCSNQLHRFMKKSISTARHSARIEDIFSAKIKEIGEAIDAERKLMDAFEQMSQISVSETSAIAMVKEITKVDMMELHNYGTRAQNTACELHTAIHNEMDEKGDTLWGLFNGVTYWTNHIRKIRGYRGEDDIMHNIMLGSGYDINNKALDLCLSLVEQTV